MKLSRLSMGVLVAASMWAAMAPPANAAPVYSPPTPAVTVYNTPGTHIIAGRAWRTSCEPYSTSVVRCRTEIWASQIVRVRGSYRQVDGWAFNNLTYLPSPRIAWASNPLGHAGAWTASDGRKWKTECDTAATGGNACRSYLWATVVGRAGSTYRNVTGWVFNNQVLFSTATIPAVSSVPKTVIQRAVLTPTGFGPLQIGTKLSQLRGAYLAPGNLCSAHRASSEVRAVGVDLMDYTDATIGNLWTSSASTPIGDSTGVSTFRVGMTLAQLKAAFPGKITLVTRSSEGGAFQAASLKEGDVELLFSKAWDDGQMTKFLPNQKVVTVRAREARSDHFYGC